MDVLVIQGGPHYHACPECYEDEACTMDCTVEHDLSFDKPMGHHAKCSRCADRFDYPFTLGGNA